MFTLTEDKRCCQVLVQSLPETVTTLTSFLSLFVEDQYHILARVSVAGGADNFSAIYNVAKKQYQLLVNLFSLFLPSRHYTESFV